MEPLVPLPPQLQLLPLHLHRQLRNLQLLAVMTMETMELMETMETTEPMDVLIQMMMIISFENDNYCH